jgi:hypothetical protein
LDFGNTERIRVNTHGHKPVVPKDCEGSGWDDALCQKTSKSFLFCPMGKNPDKNDRVQDKAVAGRLSEVYFFGRVNK